MTETTRRAVLKGVGAGTALLVGGSGVAAAGGRGHGRGDGTTAEVRVVHAIPDAPPVDVAVDGAQVLDEFPFGGVSPSLPLEKGRYDVTVSADSGGGSVTVFDEALSVAANADYTVAATGTLDGGDDADPALVPFPDDDTPAPANAARVRAVHLSPNAPPVDVAVAGGPALLTDLAFREASDYIEVPGGDYTLAVRPAGGGPGSAVFTFDVTLENATTYSAFAVGLLGSADSDAFRVVPAPDAESPAKGRSRNAR